MRERAQNKTDIRAPSLQSHVEPRPKVIKRVARLEAAIMSPRYVHNLKKKRTDEYWCLQIIRAQLLKNISDLKPSPETTYGHVSWSGKYLHQRHQVTLRYRLLSH
jgi:hypothetical protein